MVAPGASITEGHVMELETDKAVVEVPSSVSGTVQEIRVKEGDKIKVGQVIFTVETARSAKAQPRQVTAPTPPETHRSRSANAADERGSPLTPAARSLHRSPHRPPS